MKLKFFIQIVVGAIGAWFTALVGMSVFQSTGGLISNVLLLTSLMCLLTLAIPVMVICAIEDLW